MYFHIHTIVVYLPKHLDLESRTCGFPRLLLFLEVISLGQKHQFSSAFAAVVVSWNLQGLSLEAKAGQISHNAKCRIWGFSKNGGTPKINGLWMFMIYERKSHYIEFGWFGGAPILGTPYMDTDWRFAVWYRWFGGTPMFGNLRIKPVKNAGFWDCYCPNFL